MHQEEVAPKGEMGPIRDPLTPRSGGAGIMLQTPTAPRFAGSSRVRTQAGAMGPLSFTTENMEDRTLQTTIPAAQDLSQEQIDTALEHERAGCR